MEDNTYSAAECPPLENLVKKYETKNRPDCKRCKNPWFFEMETVYQCTLCGNRLIHVIPHADPSDLKYTHDSAWIKPGAKCKRYKLMHPRDHWDGEIREVVSEPWQLGHGTWIVKVTGIPGGVHVDSLEEYI
jgi:uncharacterized Zn ribbon protein